MFDLGGIHNCASSGLCTKNLHCVSLKSCLSVGHQIFRCYLEAIIQVPGPFELVGLDLKMAEVEVKG